MTTTSRQSITTGMKLSDPGMENQVPGEIRNPLPLPKKRKHEVIGFDLPDREGDDFDLPVPEDDDFDI